MKVLVTGANGFIGSHLCELLLTKGYTVRAMVRRTSNLRWLQGLKVELAYGELEDENSLAPALNEITVVFHAAAAVRAKKGEDFLRVNYTGSLRLAELAARAGVKRFVLFSSVAAAGPVKAGERLSEERTPQPVSEYGRAKLQAEQAVTALREQLHSVVLRLPVVYGPRDQDGLVFWRLLSRGIAPILGGTFSLIYVRDAAQAALLAAERTVPSGSVYFVSDGVCYSYHMLAEEWEKLTGQRVFRIRIPAWLLHLAAGLNRNLTPAGTIFNPDKVQELGQECWVCSDQRAKTELGFVPEYDLKKGIQETWQWYKEQGWI